MAFVSNFEDENKLKTAPKSGLSSAGGSSEATGGDSGGAQSSDSGGSGTGWTNLSSYLDANKGNDAQMAGKIASDSQAKLDKAGQSIGQFQSDMGSRISQNTVNQPVSDAGKYGVGISGFGETDPLDLDQGGFDKYYNAAYAGPESETDSQYYGGAAQANRDVQGLGEATKSFAGQQGLVKDSFGRSDYGQGMNYLDTFIVGAGDQGKQAMSNLGQAADRSSQNFENKVGGYGGQIDRARDTTAATQAAFRDKVGSDMANYQGQSDAARTFLDSGENTVNNSLRDANYLKGTTNQAKLRALKELAGEDTSGMFDYGTYGY